jgi:hypothetical protein
MIRNLALRLNLSAGLLIKDYQLTNEFARLVMVLPSGAVNKPSISNFRHPTPACV